MNILPAKWRPKRTTSASLGRTKEISADDKDGKGNDEGDQPANDVALKVALIGDAQAGKTALTRRFQDDRFSEEYVQTTGVNFLEKRTRVGAHGTDVVFTLCDLGSDLSSDELFPLVCDDAHAVLFVFDLTRKESLGSIKESYRRMRLLNKRAYPLLVGCKYDLFEDLDPADQAEVTQLARKFARAMNAPLIYTSASHSINVLRVFKILFGGVFGIDCKVERKDAEGEPIIEY